eukprot:1000764-Pyramimonas_sp.AAC.1
MCTDLGALLASPGGGALLARAGGASPTRDRQQEARVPMIIQSRTWGTLRHGGGVNMWQFRGGARVLRRAE